MANMANDDIKREIIALSIASKMYPYRGSDYVGFQNAAGQFVSVDLDRLAYESEVVCTLTNIARANGLQGYVNDIQSLDEAELGEVFEVYENGIRESYAGLPKEARGTYDSIVTNCSGEMLNIGTELYENGEIDARAQGMVIQAIAHAYNILGAEPDLTAGKDFKSVITPAIQADRYKNGDASLGAGQAQPIK